MDVGVRATQDAKAGDFVALRDFVRERRYPEVRSTEQSSHSAAKDKRDREHVDEISGPQALTVCLCFIYIRQQVFNLTDSISME